MPDVITGFLIRESQEIRVGRRQCEDASRNWSDAARSQGNTCLAAGTGKEWILPWNLWQESAILDFRPMAPAVDF